MKKLIAKRICATIVCGGAMVLLCGCQNVDLPFKASTPDFDKAYTAVADITCGKLEASAEVTRKNAGDWEFHFTKPETLNGMTLSLGEDGFSASLGDLSMTVEDNSYYTLVPDIISKAADSLASIPAEEITESDGVLTLNTELDGKKVTVTSDKDGNLISLKCPYHKTAVYFSAHGSPEASAATEQPLRIEGL